MFSLFLSAIISFFASWKCYIPVLHLAKMKHLEDNPGARKLQDNPVPVMGGVALFFGVMSGMLFASCLMSVTSLMPVLLTMTILLLVGVIDDMINVTPMKRFFIEIACVLGMIYGSGKCIDAVHGIFGFDFFDWYLAVPFTILAAVGIINAINMIDGVNGLSSGIGITSSFLFAILFIQNNDIPNATLNVVMAFAIVPFWIHNVFGKRSRMFIGDAGTMVLGALMSWNVIQILSHDTTTLWMEEKGISHVAVVLSILSVPVFDTLRVMAMRILHRKSPFEADRTHLHHILYDYSCSHTITALSEIILTLFLFVVGVLSFCLGCSVTWQFIIVVLSSVIFVWGLYFLLSYNSRLNTGFAFRIRKLLYSMRQGDTSWWQKLQNRVDQGA